MAVTVSRAEAQHDALDDDPPDQHHTTLWVTEARLLGEFGIHPNFAIQATLPLRFIGTNTQYTDLSGTPIQLDHPNIHHRNQVLVGLGDTQLFLHGAAKPGGFQLGGRVGFSIPSGQVNPNPFKLGDLGLPHQHLQFGTGTFDPVIGADLSRSFGAWSLAGFAQTQLPLYRGPEGYQAGTRIFGGLVGISGLGLEKVRFRLGVAAFHEFPERWDGVVPTEDGNQGRTDLFVGLGVTVPFLTDWSVSLDLRARVYGQVVGAQLQMPLIVELSLGRLFHLEAGFDEPERAVDSSVDVIDVVAAGEEVPLTPVAGKWTVFDFWAPWCEACKSLDGRLRELAAEDPRIALRRVNIVDFDSPIAVKELPGVSVLPHVRLVSPQGKIVFEASGDAPELFGKIRDELERQ